MPSSRGAERSQKAAGPQPRISTAPLGRPLEVSTVRAVEVLQKMTGASQPFLIRCDDGESYVVKFRNNPQHVRILANELLATRLANLIGLPVPFPAIVEVSPELITGKPPVEIELGSRREPGVPGLQFGSRYPGDPSKTIVVDFLPERLLRRVPNLTNVFLGSFVLDKWTCNCNGRQFIFFRRVDEAETPYTPALIDHGFCFNDGLWNFPDSPFRSFYPRRMVYEGARGFGSFEPFLSRLENIEAAQIEECVRGIPEEWCGDEPTKLQQLGEHLYERRRKIRQAIIDAKNSSLKPFPNWV